MGECDNLCEMLAGVECCKRRWMKKLIKDDESWSLLSIMMMMERETLGKWIVDGCEWRGWTIANVPEMRQVNASPVATVSRRRDQYWSSAVLFKMNSISRRCQQAFDRQSWWNEVDEYCSECYDSKDRKAQWRTPIWKERQKCYALIQDLSRYLQGPRCDSRWNYATGRTLRIGGEAIMSWRNYRKSKKPVAVRKNARAQVGCSCSLIEKVRRYLIFTVAPESQRLFLSRVRSSCSPSSCLVDTTDSQCVLDLDRPCGQRSAWLSLLSPNLNRSFKSTKPAKTSIIIKMCPQTVPRFSCLRLQLLPNAGGLGSQRICNTESLA